MPLKLYAVYACYYADLPQDERDPRHDCYLGAYPDEDLALSYVLDSRGRVCHDYCIVTFVPETPVDAIDYPEFLERTNR